MEEFNFIDREFLKKIGINSNDPYQDICDNYYDYISRLEKYTNQKENIFCCLHKNAMRSALKDIISMLNYGINNCSVWDNDTGNRHFRTVYSNIQVYKVELEKHGYKFSKN